MEDKQIVTYRKLVTLQDGVSVLLRPMVSEDYQLLVDLYSTVSNEDMRYLRHNVKDLKLIRQWCEGLDYTRVLPILAVVNKHVVGESTLHFDSGAQRHVAEVRIFLSKDYRRRGLGNYILQTMIELARKFDLHVLTAQVVSDQSHVIKAFQNLGFSQSAVLEDYFMLPDGDKRDVAIMTLNLKKSVGMF